MTEAGALGLTSKADPLATYVLNLKLSNSADADAFAQQRFVPPPQPSGPSGFQPPYLGPMYSTWDGIGSADALLVQDGAARARAGALLLTLLAIASVTVLVGRRLSEYARRVGLLKAVGGTPGTVAAMFLAENLVLALLAAAVGLGAGSLAAPLLTNPDLRHGRGPWRAVADGGHRAGGHRGSARRRPRGNARARHPRRAHQHGRRDQRRRAAATAPWRARSRYRWVLFLVLFGLRLVGRRPRRALLSAANIAVTVTGIVAVLSFHATVNGRLATAGSLTAGGRPIPSSCGTSRC